MLQLLDGDGVELVHLIEELAVLLEIERGSGRLPFQMSMVHEHGRQVCQDAW